MEIVTSNNLKGLFETGKINCFYGDVQDLIKLDIQVNGITYDDEYTVKRFLNGSSIFKNPYMDDVLKGLDIDKKFLKYKIKDLPKLTFKYVLLAYLLLNNYDNIIFDYFEVGLIYSDLKKFMNIVRNLVKAGKTVVIISHDIGFLSSLSFNLIVARENELPCVVNIIDIYKNDLGLIDDEEIIKFIKMANNRGANLDYTLNSQDLLKDIYRSVC